MSRFPWQASFEYPPGRIVRRREVTAMSSFVAWLRGGLRPRSRRTTGVLYGQSGGSTLHSDGDWRTIATAGLYADVLLPHLYVDDRILVYGASILRADTEPAVVSLVRFPMADGVLGSEIEELHSFEHDGSLAVREVQVGYHEPVEIERGYVYRVRVTAGNDGDIVYGGFVDTDHPKVS